MWLSFFDVLKYPHKSRQERFIWLAIQSSIPINRKQYLELAGHVTATIRRMRGMNACTQLAFSYLVSPGPKARG